MNKLRVVIILGLIWGIPCLVFGNTIKQEVINWETVESMAGSLDSADSIVLNQKNKTVAITLAVTLGAFGVHRLYLGTSNKVPIIYTLTLGGGFGVLMVSDIVALIATKDINTYSPSEKVFMWAK